MKKKSKKIYKVKTPQGTRTYVGKPPANPSPVTTSVSHCTFLNSTLALGSKSLDKFASKACYERDEHKMYHAVGVTCPCHLNGIPVVVYNHKGNQEVRIYGHDIMLINGDKALCLSDVFTLIDKLQKRIEDLEKNSQSGS